MDPQNLTYAVLSGLVVFLALIASLILPYVKRK